VSLIYYSCIVKIFDFSYTTKKVTIVVTFYRCISNISFPSPQTGLTQFSGKSSNSVPGLIPAFSFPDFGL